MLDEPHTLIFELPEYSREIERLEAADADFRALLHAYDTLDGRIQSFELAGLPIDDAHAEDLKKRRLALKDRLFKRLTLDTPA